MRSKDAKLRPEDEENFEKNASLDYSNSDKSKSKGKPEVENDSRKHPNK